MYLLLLCYEPLLVCGWLVNTLHSEPSGQWVCLLDAIVWRSVFQFFRVNTCAGPLNNFWKLGSYLQCLKMCQLNISQAHEKLFFFFNIHMSKPYKVLPWSHKNSMRKCSLHFFWCLCKPKSRQLKLVHMYKKNQLRLSSPKVWKISLKQPPRKSQCWSFRQRWLCGRNSDHNIDFAWFSNSMQVKKCQQRNTYKLAMKFLHSTLSQSFLNCACDFFSIGFPHDFSVVSVIKN